MAGGGSICYPETRYRYRPSIVYPCAARDPRASGTSGQRTSAGGDCTFGVLCDQYLAAADGGRRLRASSTLPHYARLIKAEIAPVFGGGDPGEIMRSDVREWSERLG